MPSAGHVIAGETIINGAIREANEVLGIMTKAEDYFFEGEYIADTSFELAQVYLFKLDIDISEFKLQKEEVEDIKWLSLDEFKELYYSNKFVSFDTDYKVLVMNLLIKEFNLYNIVLTASGFNDINNFVSDKMRDFFSNISNNKKIMLSAFHFPCFK